MLQVLDLSRDRDGKFSQLFLITRSSSANATLGHHQRSCFQIAEYHFRLERKRIMTRLQLDRLLEKTVADALGVELEVRDAAAQRAPSAYQLKHRRAAERTPEHA